MYLIQHCFWVPPFCSPKNLKKRLVQTWEMIDVVLCKMMSPRSSTKQEILDRSSEKIFQLSNTHRIASGHWSSGTVVVSLKQKGVCFAKYFLLITTIFTLFFIYRYSFQAIITMCPNPNIDDEKKQTRKFLWSSSLFHCVRRNWPWLLLRTVSDHCRCFFWCYWRDWMHEPSFHDQLRRDPSHVDRGLCHPDGRRTRIFGVLCF
jgi:hypothetical protein